MALSPDEETLLLWFDGKLRSRHAAGDPTNRFDLRDYRQSLPLGEPRSWDVAADLEEKGYLKATPQVFHWDSLTGGGTDRWFEIELTDSGRTEVRRLRRWWRRLAVKLRPGAVASNARGA